MAPSNEAFVLRGANKAGVEPFEMPSEPGPNDVMCRTLAVGICGSDIHYWKDGRLSNFVVEEPIALGHETAAVVVKVGAKVKHLKVGDRVAVEPAIGCGECEYCESDQYNLCTNMFCQATPPYHGTLQHYFTHPAKYCFKVPDSLTNDECAMVEPLAVGVHAVRRANITVGSTVLITGSGPIGLFSLQCAKAYGASRVVTTDINEMRLKAAREMGADETILVTRDTTEAQMLEKIRKVFGGDLPTVSLECSGVGVNFRLVMLATKSAGTCMFVGMGPSELQLPIADAATREVKMFGSYRYKGCFPLAIDLIASKRVNLVKMASHHFDFKDSLKAFDVAHKGEGIKIIINVDRH